MLPDDRLRDLLRSDEDRTRPDPAFLDALYDRLDQERRRRRSPWSRFATAFGPILVPAGAIAAVLIVAIGGTLLFGNRATGPAASPGPTLSAAPSASASRSVGPSPSNRSLGVAFKEIPAWIVPADAVPEAASFSEDGYWSQTYQVPRAPSDVLADFESRILNQGIKLETDTNVVSTEARTRGVSPSIVVTVAPIGSGTLVSITFDSRDN